MPNEIKNPLSATTFLNSVATNAVVTPELDKNGSDIKKSRLAGNSLTVTVWTMAGVVLAACVGGSTRYLEVEGDGIGGGGTDLPGGGTDTPTGNTDYPVFVADGPVQGAKILIDGEVVGTTGADGRADIDSKYEGQQFTVNVEGAIDTYTGKTLSGTFTSLANGEGGIATPLTTLVAEKAAADGSSNEAALDALINDIFGATTNGEYDDVLSVEDITNFDHYTRQYDENQRFDTPQGESEAYKSDVITTLSLALTEYWNKSVTDANGNISNSYGATPLDALKAIGARIKDNTVDNDDSNDTSFINEIQGLIDNGKANPLATGAPMATPETGITIDEDTAFNVGDYVGNNDDLIAELFGFSDPGGNKANETASSFKGIMIIVDDLAPYTLTLGDGADVIIHRFRSFPDTASDDYINSDGGDVIHNFNVGTDKLLLVDENTSTPLANWEAFIAATDATHGVRFDVITNASDEITGLKIDIGLQGTVDGEDAGVDAGDTLTINFVTPVANSASDVTNGTVNEASELAFVTQLLGGADYVDVISVDDLSTDYGITIV